jgi:hypothetical protein
MDDSLLRELPDVTYHGVLIIDMQRGTRSLDHVVITPAVRF